MSVAQHPVAAEKVFAVLVLISPYLLKALRLNPGPVDEILSTVAPYVAHPRLSAKPE